MIVLLLQRGNNIESIGKKMTIAFKEVKMFNAIYGLSNKSPSKEVKGGEWKIYRNIWGCLFCLKNEEGGKKKAR